MGEMIKIDTLDGDDRFGGYLAIPRGTGPWPGIVVLQEIFGVNAGIRAMCDDWAAEGFVALAPDLFWRLEPGIQLSDKTEAEWDRALALMNRFDVDHGIRDIEATIRALRGHPVCSGKVGVVGFCLGGKLAYLSATRTDSDATVGYYAVGLDALLGESHAISRPLMLHIAEEDKFVSKNAQAKIHAALGGSRKVTLFDYPGVDHAFARVDGVRRDEEAAARANERTLAFFREHLG
jgi:carboxymethylenebutenolidase